MRIQHNIMTLDSHKQLGLVSDTIGESLEKLSSGCRVNYAGGGAAGLATSEKIKAQTKGLESATANTQDAISPVRTAEGAMQEVYTVLNRVAGSATKTVNSAYDATDRQAIIDEVEALNEEIDRISTSVGFNGKKLLDSTATALVLQAGPTVADMVTVKINKMDPTTLHPDALGFTSTSDANTALTATKKVTDGVSRARSSIGVLQNHLDHTMDNLGTTKENLTVTESRIRDIDMAGEMINYTKSNVLVQSAQAMLAQTNLQLQSILQLLQ